MATTEVYSATTAPNPKDSCFKVPSEHLDKIRFSIKVVEVLLSFVAFILEEVVNSCISCTALYFFEFVSCTAFLFTLLLLVLLSTSLHKRVGITHWTRVDFLYTSIIAVFFLIANIAFGANSNKPLEKTAVAFGFMAMLAFILDLLYFIKSVGFPFKRSSTTETINGAAASAEAPPETERLNAAAANGAE